jgi:hypothetical protein
MKKITDYNLGDSWHLRQLSMKPNEEFIVLTDVDDLKKDDQVKFIGFDDVDNHYGIFVFLNAQGEVLEVRGDFSGSESLHKVERALSRI